MTTPSNLPYGTALTGENAQLWAEQILSDLNAPETAADIQTLEDWFEREGGGGANNPLNTTLVTSGSTGSINSVGVQSYNSPQTGAAAEAQTIQSGYPAILSALQSGSGFVGSTSPAIQGELSTWSGGGYSSVSGTPAVDTSIIGDFGSGIAGGALGTANPLGSLTDLDNFFKDLTSADLWERLALMMFGGLLMLIGIIILAAPGAMSLLGMSTRVGRQSRSLFGSQGSGMQGPTDEERADRSRRLALAEENTRIGAQKVQNQTQRNALASRRMDLAEAAESRKAKLHSGKEPNPEPPHSSDSSSSEEGDW